MLDLVKRTSEDTFVPITVGGGISTVNQISEFLSSGADRVFINSSFIRNKILLRISKIFWIIYNFVRN